MWSLTEQALVARLDSPKLLPPKGLDFSGNGLFMVLLQRLAGEGKRVVSIYYAGADWKLTN